MDSPVLRLGAQVRLTRGHVDRHGDVLVDKEPLPVDLLVDVGDADCDILRLSIFVRAGRSEEAVPESEVSLGLHLPIAHLRMKSAGVACQKALPVFSVRRSADVLAWRDQIKNDETLVRYVVLHDGVKVFGI